QFDRWVRNAGVTISFQYMRLFTGPRGLPTHNRESEDGHLGVVRTDRRAPPAVPAPSAMDCSRLRRPLGRGRGKSCRRVKIVATTVGQATSLGVQGAGSNERMIVNLPVTAEAAVLGQIVSVSGSRLSAVLSAARGPGGGQVRIGDLLRIEAPDGAV